jgi:hypothetical protein
MSRYSAISRDCGFVVVVDEVGFRERSLTRLRRGVYLVLALVGGAVVVVVEDVVVFIKGNVIDEVNGRVSGLSGSNQFSASWVIG